MSNSIEAVKKAAGMAPSQPKTVDQIIDSMVPEFAKIVGKSMDPVRLARIAYMQVKANRGLSNDVPGLLSCIALSATLKLEPGVMGHCYYIPYGKDQSTKAQFITGWTGHVDLVSRAGRAAVRTLAVREGDEFDCNLGSKPFVHFKPDTTGDNDRPLLHTVALGHIKGLDDYPEIEIWGLSKLKKHLKRYNKVGAKHYALQTGDNLATSHNFEMYARKLPLLQVVKYVPKSVEWQIAAQLDHMADTIGQNLTFNTTQALIEGDTLTTTEDEITSPFDELFDALDWNNDERKAFIEKHAKTTDKEQIRAELNRLVDERNAEEK